MNYKELVNYRLHRAKETLDDARILSERRKWNSAINRLYYAAFYAVTALLMADNINPLSHNGAKVKFSENYIKTGKVPKEYGKMYSQLFLWRQKGDYDDLFDFNQEKVEPYLEPVESFINLIKEIINNYI
ncbi:MAG: HEPN domain-containing protein [Bacteroidia bacterium]